MAAVSRGFLPTGFSQKICLPWLAAWRTISRCRLFGAAIFTTSTRGIFNDSSPICRLLLKTKSAPSSAGSGFDVIGTNNELGMKRTLRKTLDDLAVRSAVHFTHPTHANDPDSYDTWHCSGPLL